MSAYDFEEQDELQYRVTGRELRPTSRLPRRYSPRFDKPCRTKQTTAGIHRRGSQQTMIQHAA